MEAIDVDGYKNQWYIDFMKVFACRRQMTWVSWGISIFSGRSIYKPWTWAKWVHTGLMFPEHAGKNRPNGNKGPIGRFLTYDASEKRGQVQWAGSITKYHKREIIVFDIPDPEAAGFKYAMSRFGVNYSYAELALWFLNYNDNGKRDFCSELTLGACNAAGLPDHKELPVVQYLKRSPQTQVEYLKLLSEISNSGVTLEYQGPAYKYKPG